MKVQCNQGHDIVGASSITCLLDGNWSALPPICEGKQFFFGKLPCLKIVQQFDRS